MSFSSFSFILNFKCILLIFVRNFERFEDACSTSGQCESSDSLPQSANAKALLMIILMMIVCKSHQPGMT